jgi:8-oxo-dGTP pyrophosphatase MutT (NUDIX family)
MSRLAIIPLHRIPKYCPECGTAFPDSERVRQTHPFVCDRPHGSDGKRYLHFISPQPVSVHILFVRLVSGGLGVVMGRRGLEYEVAFRKWALPGGFIEAETGAEAALDEFREELGVDVSSVPIEHVAERYDSSTFCSIHFYAGLWQHPVPPQLQCTRETLETGIFPIDQLPIDLAFPYQAEIIQKAALRFVP